MPPNRASARPLAVRIPLIVVAMLAISMASMVWLGYNRVNRFTEDAERSRLGATTQQRTAIFAAQLARLRIALPRLSDKAAVREAASTFATPAQRANAAADLGAYRRSSAQFL